VKLEAVEGVGGDGGDRMRRVRPPGDKGRGALL
jgi:hypothetical protein